MIRLFTIMSLALTIVGCVSNTYSVDVDSIARNNTAYSKAFVVSTSKDAAIIQQAFKRYVERALEKEKFEVVSSAQEADIVVMFNYGMSSSQEIASSPTYEWVAPQSYNFQSSTSNAYGQPRYSTTGTATEQGIGHLQQTGQETHTEWSYLRFIVIKAFAAEDLKNKNSAPVELWQTTITSRGTSSDMRSAFPAMLAAGAPAFGRDTKGQVRIEMPGDAKPVKELTAETRTPTGRLAPKHQKDRNAINAED